MLIKLLTYWATRFARVEFIEGHGGEGVYLIRYHLINNRFFKLYLHYFLRSDMDDPHDHPWNFWTLMLQGEYTEELYDWRTRTFIRTRRSPVSNAFIQRKATDIHRIVVDKPYLYGRDDWRSAPMTLFFSTRKRQDWGFVEDYKTAPRWQLWSKYLSRRKDSA